MTTCKGCIHKAVCGKAQHIENYKIIGGCDKYRSEESTQKADAGEKWLEEGRIHTSDKGRSTWYTVYICPICGKSNGKHKTNYCPHCGTKMRGDKNE